MMNMISYTDEKKIRDISTIDDICDAFSDHTLISFLCSIKNLFGEETIKSYMKNTISNLNIKNPDGTPKRLNDSWIIQTANKMEKENFKGYNITIPENLRNTSSNIFGITMRSGRLFSSIFQAYRGIQYWKTTKKTENSNNDYFYKYSWFNFIPHYTYNIIKNKKVVKKFNELKDEVHYLINYGSLKHTLNSIPNAIKKYSQKYENQDFSNYTAFEVYRHFLHQTNHYFIQSHSKRMNLNRIHHLYYRMRLHRYYHINKTKHWNDDFYDDDNNFIDLNEHKIKNNIKRWSGFTGGDNTFYVFSPIDWIYGLLYLLSWILHIDFLNQNNCNPGFPYLPLVSDGCMYPFFIGVSLVFTLFPPGFDPNNAMCGSYSSLIGWLKGFIYLIFTPWLGPIVAVHPGWDPLPFGILVWYPLPANLLPCIIGNVFYGILFFLIVVSILLIISITLSTITRFQIALDAVEEEQKKIQKQEEQTYDTV